MERSIKIENWGDKCNNILDEIIFYLKCPQSNNDKILDDSDNRILPIRLIMPSLELIKFKEMRKSKGITLMQVEEATGISNSYLSQLENNKIKSPSYNVVRELYMFYN